MSLSDEQENRLQVIKDLAEISTARHVGGSSRPSLKKLMLAADWVMYGNDPELVGTDFLIPPPEPFSNNVVHCPSCKHGIDPHGTDPGGACGVGDVNRNLCPCMWSPNDIAAYWSAPLGEIRLLLHEYDDNPSTLFPTERLREILHHASVQPNRQETDDPGAGH